jgi:hypothetical protein
MKGKTCGLVGWTWKNKPIRKKTNKLQASGGTRTHAHSHTAMHATQGHPATADAVTQASQEPPRGDTQDAWASRIMPVLWYVFVGVFAHTVPVTCSHSVQLIHVDMLEIQGIFPHPV